MEIIPEPGEYPVKAGQKIALSGNTGYSFGPHLHLDVFETETGDYIDPMPFFKKNLKDTRAPKADGIMLFLNRGKEWSAEVRRIKQFFQILNGPWKRGESSVRASRRMTIWTG